jgi:hypothetical protein
MNKPDYLHISSFIMKYICVTELPLFKIQTQFILINGSSGEIKILFNLLQSSIIEHIFFVESIQ